MKNWYCLECATPVTPRQEGFGNLAPKIANAEWVSDENNQKRALCFNCKRKPEIWAKYSANSNAWKRELSGVKKTVSSANRFLFGILIIVVVIVVVTVIISVLMHNGSCIGPEGDYSTCYP